MQDNQVKCVPKVRVLLEIVRNKSCESSIDSCSTYSSHTEEGVTFTPVVAEAHNGSWGPSAQKMFNELAKTKSLITGESKPTVLMQLYQNLGVTLHRENAKAIVKRTRRFTHNLHDLLATATTLQTAAVDAAYSSL